MALSIERGGAGPPNLFTLHFTLLHAHKSTYMRPSVILACTRLIRRYINVCARVCVCHLFPSHFCSDMFIDDRDTRTHTCLTRLFRFGPRFWCGASSTPPSFALSNHASPAMCRPSISGSVHTHE